MSPETVADKLINDDGTIDARNLNDGSGRGPGGIRNKITARDCYRIRVALLYGAELREHARASHFQRSGAHYHASGACRHDDSAAPPVEHTCPEHAAAGEWRVKE